MKAFLIDVAKCNGCHNCQISCKDEHCGTSWLPYAAEQPMTGQFWCKVEEKVRGTVPVVRINYVPFIGAQNEAIKEYAPEVLMEREDGLVVIDPEKAVGRKDLAEKFEGVYWNEELQLPQGCTGCAHLLDDGWTVPRCVDACCTNAIQFGEESELDLEGAENHPNQAGMGSHVWYKNFPKRFVAGCLIDFDVREAVIGAEVSLCNEAGVEVANTVTDEFGDFMFDQYAATKYIVKYNGKDIEADATEKDLNLGDLAY